MNKRIAFYIGAWLALPFALLMAIVAQLGSLPYPPAEFFSWLVDLAPPTVAITGLAVTIAAVLVINQDASTIVEVLGQVVALLTWLLISGGLGVVVNQFGQRLHLRHGTVIAGVVVGALWGVGVAFLISTNPPNIIHPLGIFGWCLLFLATWGALLGWIYMRLGETQPPIKATHETIPDPNLTPAPVPIATRRQFLCQVVMGTGAATLVSSGGLIATRRISQERNIQQLTKALELPSHFPQSLQVRVYPASANFQFPEFKHDRYHPQKHPFGVCIAGGGTVAMCAATGLMRGLQTLGLLDAVGAVSCVSGGAWFTSIWSYAPATIADTTLLGDIYHPSELTLAHLSEIDPRHLMSPVPELTTVRLLETKTARMVASTRSPLQAFDRVYARTLNQVFLNPFGLDDPNKLFTLDETNVAEIRARNPQLTIDDFYTVRPNRPYFIAGINNAFPLGADQKLRQFELSPLYGGTLQLFKGQGEDGDDIGGGFVETMAFDSTTPFAIGADGVATVPTPAPPFLLSDLMASSGAAPGILTNFIEKPEWFPKFRHWSPIHASPQAAPRYSFVDGGNLENLGIVPLLRRQYPVILALLGAAPAVGSDNPSGVRGIAGSISRLFGFNPESTFVSDQDIQIFPAAQFDSLVQGMGQAVERGGPAIFVDQYQIVQPNAFDIPAYPDGGRVTIVWMHNHLNQEWFDQLSPSVRSLFERDDPTNNLSNFPNYSIFFQNSNGVGVPQMLLLTPEQIHLMSQMWSYTITDGMADSLHQLRQQHL